MDISIDGRQGQETTKNKVHILSLVVSVVFSLVLVPVSRFAPLPMDHLWWFFSRSGILCDCVSDTQYSAINQQAKRSTKLFVLSISTGCRVTLKLYFLCVDGYVVMVNNLGDLWKPYLRNFFDITKLRGRKTGKVGQDLETELSLISCATLSWLISQKFSPLCS